MKTDFLMRRIQQDEEFLSKTGWSIGPIIAYYAKEYGLGSIIYADEASDWQKGHSTLITAAINSMSVSDTVSHSFTDYCFEHNIPIVYPINMGWGAVVIVAKNDAPLEIAKKTKTGNYNDDIRAYIGRYVSFWSHQTPASLLLNNNPVFSNTLMLQISLYVVAVIASGKPVKPFPDMYYCLCNPGKRI